jgi:hypothetical protein
VHATDVDTVQIYDTLNRFPPVQSLNLIAQYHRCRGQHITFERIDVMPQPGATECGYMLCANAATLVFNGIGVMLL